MSIAFTTDISTGNVLMTCLKPLTCTRAIRAWLLSVLARSCGFRVGGLSEMI